MKLYKKDMRDFLLLAIFAIVGGGLSALFILQYNAWNHIALTILTAILSFAYMLGCMILLDKKDIGFQVNLKLVLLFPLAYVAIVFLALLFLFHKKIPGDFSVILDCLMWSIYAMPSFVIVILLAVLLLAAMAYV